MTIMLMQGCSSGDVERVSSELEEMGFRVRSSTSAPRATIDCDPPAMGLDSEVIRRIEELGCVEEVLHDSNTAQLVSATADRQRSKVSLGDVEIGGNAVIVMAGPCSVESEAQLIQTAEFVASLGIRVLRGGAFKPSTSPYGFQGLGTEGLKLLRDVAHAYNLKIVTEVMDTRRVEEVSEIADMLQVGARNMQNFDLLHEVGKSTKPVLLKRGFSNTLDEWILAAEHVAVQGNESIVLCERGIRTFERRTRNTLDLSAVPLAHMLTRLPVIVDPSQGTGRRDLVEPMSRAAVAVGADGLLIEVHPDPDHALKDGPQSLTPAQLQRLMPTLAATAEAIGRRIA